MKKKNNWFISKGKCKEKERKRKKLNRNIIVLISNVTKVCAFFFILAPFGFVILFIYWYTFADFLHCCCCCPLVHGKVRLWKVNNFSQLSFKFLLLCLYIIFLFISSLMADKLFRFIIISKSSISIKTFHFFLAHKLYNDINSFFFLSFLLLLLLLL